MKKRLNYLGFFGFLFLIGFIGIFDSESRFTLSFFATIGYFSYFFVEPDELFMKRLFQTGLFTLGIVFMTMLGFYIAYLLTKDVSFFVNGFWISFTVITVTFPVIFAIYEYKDTVKPE